MAYHIHPKRDTDEKIWKWSVKTGVLRISPALAITFSETYTH